MQNITLISTEDLLTELFNRHEYAVFASYQNGVYHKNEYVKKCKFKGDLVLCSGLTRVLDRTIQDKMKAGERDIDGYKENTT